MLPSHLFWEERRYYGEIGCRPNDQDRSIQYDQNILSHVTKPGSDFDVQLNQYFVKM